MRLLLVGPPGSGKGTQAGRLAAHYGIAHLASGDLLRREVEQGTPIGKIAAGYIQRGDLVPDEIALRVMAGPILEAARRGGYVLDGFPRTVHQAEEAYRMAERIDGIELQAVVHLKVGRDELRRRLLHRHGQEGRADDIQATINHRLRVYDAETAPLLDFYARRGLVAEVNGEKHPDKVFADIVAALDALESERRRPV